MINPIERLNEIFALRKEIDDNDEQLGELLTQKRISKDDVSKMKELENEINSLCFKINHLEEELVKLERDE